MKCPKCGYVSFDDVEACKGCGAALGTEDEAEPEERSPLQDALFGDADEKGVAAKEEQESEEKPFRGEGPEGEPAAKGLELPDMSIDYDPADEELSPPVPEGGREDEEGQGDDEDELPDELWLEESAGFLYRAGAFAVDAAVLCGVLLLFGAGAWMALSPEELGIGVFAAPGVIIAFYLLGLLVSIGYYTFFVGWSGRTPGKRLMRLDVRRNDGGPMTYSRAFLRWAGYLVSFTFAGLGFFWIIFDERKKGWHDYLSGTWVRDLRHEE